MKKTQRVLAAAILVATASSFAAVPASAGVIWPANRNTISSSSLSLDEGTGSPFSPFRLAASSVLSRVLLRIALVG